MLGKFGQTEAKPVSTPADLNVKLQKEYGFSRPLDVTSYESIVGSLLYAAIATRPDIAQAVGVVFLHQRHFVEKMHEKFGQTEAKPVSTPANLNVKLQEEDGFSRPVDVTSYQSIVGSLLHAAIATRPDIARAVRVVSKFCANPTQNHLTATKRILRYLKATAYLGLRYKCWWKFHWLFRCKLGGWYGWPVFHFRKRVLTGWWGSKLA